MTALSAPFSRRPTWFLGLLLAGSSLLAQAQPAGQAAAAQPVPHAHGHLGEHGAHMADRANQMQARQARRLEELKGRLQLTPAQDSAWAGYTRALQTRPAHAGSPETLRQDLGSLSTPERLERMKALRTQRQAEMNAFMDRRAEATKTFYAGLTPEQQKIFDTETARLMQARGAGHHLHGHHGHGGRG